MAKQIPLTQGQVAIVDDWHYDELKQFKWHARWSKYTQSYYADRNEGKAPFRKRILMQRQIMKTPPGMECDHKNHNTLDNQEHNLRNVTKQQNRMNKKAYTNNLLGEKCIRRDGESFRVRIKKDGQVVYSKSFKTLDEAVTARDEAIMKHHGEFSYLG
jgi:hypothetical protein